jgi:hypothetical protein
MVLVMRSAKMERATLPSMADCGNEAAGAVRGKGGIAFKLLRSLVPPLQCSDGLALPPFMAKASNA